ncbi:MAG: OprO/OprP family phosphate-selective porin [Planctomycetaceae bacterium]
MLGWLLAVSAPGGVLAGPPSAADAVAGAEEGLPPVPALPDVRELPDGLDAADEVFIPEGSELKEPGAGDLEAEPLALGADDAKGGKSRPAKESREEGGDGAAEEVDEEGPPTAEAMWRRVQKLERQLAERDAAEKKAKEQAKKKQQADEAKKAEADRKKAEEEAKKADPRRQKFVTRPFGRIHVDAVTFDQDQANIDTVGNALNGVDIRRARLGVEGEGYGRYFYRFDVDFVTLDQQVATRPVIVDAYLDIQQLDWLGNLRVGHFREPFSLERLDSTHDLPFLERSNPVNVLTPFRNVGAMVFNNNEEETVTWASGLFFENTNELGETLRDQTPLAFTTRATWNPWYELDEECHDLRMFALGASYSFRHTTGVTRNFGIPPEVVVKEGVLRRTPNFVNTGQIAVGDLNLVGLEAVTVLGSFSLEGEYLVNAGSQGTNGGDLFFQGAYVEAMYFLTGEHRNYQRKTGNFGAVAIQDPFVVTKDENGCRRNGLGAFEVAARLSWIDLDHQQIHGGELTDLTLGLNWYYTLRSRVMFNYVRAMLDRGNRDSNADIFGVRFQYAF